MRFKIFILSVLFLIGMTVESFAAYYVRTDGGTPNGAGGTTVCNGQTDAPAAGNSPNCAFNHPNWSIPANGQPTTWKLPAGDTLYIAGPQDGKGTGVYRMGCQGTANCLDATINMTGTTCNPSASYDCGNIVVNSGPNNSTRTTIKGCGPSGCGSNKYPELWLAGRMDSLFDMTGSSNITWSNLEITDHAAQGHLNECVVGTTTLCGRQAFKANGGWFNITHEYLYIHGLTYQAMKIGGQAGGGTDLNWRMDNVRIEFNAFAGIDTDTCFNAGTCGFKGPVVWRDVTFKWAGCVEPYPIVTPDTPVANSCRTGETGGYSDAFGGSDSGGNWDIDGITCKFNASDCLDLLYCGRTDRSNYGRCTVKVNRMNCEGNAGNCIKGPTDLIITNSKLNGNCAWWSTHTNFYQPGSAMCRDGGRAANPIAISTNEQSFIGTPYIANNTIMSNADIVINYGGACPSPASVIYKNNIIIGGWDIGSQNVGELPDAFYVSGRVVTNDGCSQVGSGQPFANITPIEDHNLCVGSTLKNGAEDCSHATDKNVDPQFIGTLQQGIPTYPTIYSGFDYNAILSLGPSSPAINSADPTVSNMNGLDFNNYDRGPDWDIGAEEYGSSGGTTPSEDGATCLSSGVCSGGNCCYGKCSSTTCDVLPATNKNKIRLHGTFGR